MQYSEEELRGNVGAYSMRQRTVVINDGDLSTYRSNGDPARRRYQEQFY